MKRKSLVSISIILLMIMIAMFVPRKVFASTEYPEQPSIRELGSVVSVGANGLNDSMAYFKLAEVYNSYYGLSAGDRIDELRQFMFKGMDFAVFDGVLDLGGGGVQTLEGLELIDFSQCYNLTTLKLNNNQLTTITARSTSQFNNIETLDISGNKLTSADLSSFENLKNLNASKNDFTNLNLTFIKTETKEANINLVDNPISNAEDVTFRREGLLDHNINLYLLNTLSTDVYTGNNKIKVYAGLIGLNTTEKYTKDSELLFKKIDNLQYLNIAVQDILLHIVDYANPNTQIVEPISNASIIELVDLLSKLEYGKYMLYFTDENGYSVSNSCPSLVDKFSGYTIEYAPYSPTLVATSNNKQIDLVSGEYLEQKTQIHFSSADENSVIFYKIGNSGEWIQATSVTLEKGHIDTLYVKSVMNGIDSEVIVVNFGLDDSFGIDELITIALVAIASLVLFFVMIPVMRYFIHKPLNVKMKSKKEKE